MIARNITMFRYPAAVIDALTPISLGEALNENRLKQIGPLELGSRGFVSPIGREAVDYGGDLGIWSVGATPPLTVWVTVGGEDKILPGSVVNAALAQKLAEIEKAEGRKPGVRARKRIKDELITDLLPLAFVRPSRLDAYLDTGLQLLVVDTPSRKQAESVVSEIRRALGSFPALPLNAEKSVRAVMTGWLAGDPLPEGLTLGDEAELRDPVDNGGIVKVSRHELHGDEIEKHLETGKQVTKLGLVFEDRISFVLGEDFVLRKFKLLDGAIDMLEETEREGLEAELMARFTLMTGEFRRLFAVLDTALSFSKVE